ncbi:MAG: hypothetical protein PGN22_02650 [Agrobacterium cavarae]
MSQKFCRNCGKWHVTDEWPLECLAVPPQGASDALPVPNFISDTMEPVQSMLDGRHYSSKSALRATYKAAGVTEVGNDPARLRPRRKPKPDRKAIRDSIEKATARFSRGERSTPQ